MSVTIIVKKYGNPTKGGSTTQGFYQHWNHAMDKQPVWISSRKQYDYEMKKRGLVKYDPDFKDSPKHEELKVTKETRKVVNAIRNQSDSNGKLSPSGDLTKELIRRKVVMKRDMKDKIDQRIAPISDIKKGGFYASE